MGIAEKLFGKESTPKRAQNDYIDLSEYATGERPGEVAAANTFIRVAEIHKYEDLKEFAGYVYDGNMLILDVKPLMQDEIQLKRATNDLRKLAQDVGGDIAGLGESFIMLCPTGIKVDRRKLKAGSG
jgi:SepF-like predicted cell division protein (DUF552 family)